jgi:hypothetical protein
MPITREIFAGPLGLNDDDDNKGQGVGSKSKNSVPKTSGMTSASEENSEPQVSDFLSGFPNDFFSFLIGAPQTPNPRSAIFPLPFFQDFPISLSIPKRATRPPPLSRVKTFGLRPLLEKKKKKKQCDDAAARMTKGPKFF